MQGHEKVQIDIDESDTVRFGRRWNCCFKDPEMEKQFVRTLYAWPRTRIRVVIGSIGILWLSTLFVSQYIGVMQLAGRPTPSVLCLIAALVLSRPPEAEITASSRWRSFRFLPYVPAEWAELCVLLPMAWMLLWGFMSNVLYINDPSSFFTKSAAKAFAPYAAVEFLPEMNLCLIACCAALGVRAHAYALAAIPSSMVPVVAGFVATHQLHPLRVFIVRIFILLLSYVAAIAVAATENSAQRRQLELATILEDKRKESAESAERIGRLIAALLPASVAQRLQNGSPVADAFPHATVLFTDVVGFTQWSAAEGRRAGDVVRMLNAMFSQFDALALQFGAEKIKTIGDAYWCVCGLNIEGSGPKPDIAAQSAVELGINMIDALKTPDLKVNKSDNPKGKEPASNPLADVQIRVGIHSGPVVAAIVGRLKPSYDVFGLTTQLANKMESTGTPGRVHISLSTHELVRQVYRCVPAPHVGVDGLGEMPTFLVIGPANGADGPHSPVGAMASVHTMTPMLPNAVDWSTVDREPSGPLQSTMSKKHFSANVYLASSRSSSMSSSVAQHNPAVQRRRVLATERWGLLAALASTEDSNYEFEAGPGAPGDQMPEGVLDNVAVVSKSRRWFFLNQESAAEKRYQRWRGKATLPMRNSALALAFCLETALVVVMLILNSNSIKHAGGICGVICTALVGVMWLYGRVSLRMYNFRNRSAVPGQDPGIGLVPSPAVVVSPGDEENRFELSSPSNIFRHESSHPFSRLGIAILLHFALFVVVATVPLYDELAPQEIAELEPAVKVNFMFWQHIAMVTVLGIMPHLPLPCKAVALTAATVCAIIVRSVAFLGKPVPSIQGYVFDVLAAWFVVLLAGLCTDHTLRLQHDSQARTKAEYLKLDVDSQLHQDFLRLLYPVSVIPRIAAAQGATTANVIDECPFAAVMFAKLHGLDGIRLQRSPREMLALLNRLYTEFDTTLSSSSQNLEKIKNIGTTYMVVAGIDQGASPSLEKYAEIEQSQICSELAHFAVRIFSIVQRFSKSRTLDHPLSISIGIHAGPVVGAVIGSENKAIYDVFGDTVNTASRVMSTAPANAVCVSEAFATSLCEGKAARTSTPGASPGGVRTWLATPRKLSSPISFPNPAAPTALPEFRLTGPYMVEAKGKGTLATFHLESAVPEVDNDCVTCVSSASGGALHSGPRHLAMSSVAP
eukprot:TRINITY_DN4002_c0_g1_i1.p1 TRINITY_DN4002_c0_g1~~TRINITY_DN4002_c0_g1_i1.p1  ORF type:complete len:1193 (+),score=169.51 TRINITY_DN4002_c0_g1_i1:51-3629(+)